MTIIISRLVSDFAFLAEKNTVIRGAYGLFYQRDAACTWVNISINAPFIRTGDAVLSVNQTSYQTFPVDNLTPVVGYLAPGSKPAVTGINVDMHESYVHQWNLYIDHTFAKDLVVKAGYVGNHALNSNMTVCCYLVVVFYSFEVVFPLGSW